MNTDYILVKLYLINNLIAFETPKKKNANIIRQAINALKALKEDAGIEGLLTIIKQTRKVLQVRGQRSRRLSCFLMNLQSQVQHMNLLSEWGASDIKPNNVGDRTLVEMKNIKSTFIDYILNLPNSRNNPAVVYNEKGMPDDIIDAIDFNKLAIVYVSGGSNNPYGHAILSLGGQGFIHVNTLCARPQHMINNDYFAAYLKKQGGSVMAIQQIPVRDVEAAKRAIKIFSKDRWFWKLTHNNCLSFAHTIAFAAGATTVELGYNRWYGKLPRKYMANDHGGPGYVPSTFFNGHLVASLNGNSSKHFNAEANGMVQQHRKQFDIKNNNTLQPHKTQWQVHFKQLLLIIQDSNEPTDKERSIAKFYANLCCSGLTPVKAFELTSKLYEFDVSFKNSIKKKLASMNDIAKHFFDDYRDNVRAGVDSVMTMFKRHKPTQSPIQLARFASEENELDAALN